MSKNCLTVSCVLRRTILLNQIRAKVAHITLTTRVIRSQRQSAYSTLTYILRRTFKAESYNSLTIVAHIALTIQVKFVISTNC